MQNRVKVCLLSFLFFLLFLFLFVCAIYFDDRLMIVGNVLRDLIFLRPGRDGCGLLFSLRSVYFHGRGRRAARFDFSEARHKEACERKSEKPLGLSPRVGV